MDGIFLQSPPLIEWETFLWGEVESKFLAEIALRCLIMFIVVVAGLRLMGKRAVKQISIYELVVIISLGSAAGDSMLSDSVGLLPAATVFVTIIILYRLVTYFIGKSKKFEILLEGVPVKLVENGRFSIEDFSKELLAYDEFFSELRVRGVTHLGQVKTAYIETTGEISVFFFKDEDVRYGLPIMPQKFVRKVKNIVQSDHYACEFCGNTDYLKEGGPYECKICQHDIWVVAEKDVRVT